MAGATSSYIGQRDGHGRCQPLVSDTMKTISLRTLVREPLKVKRMTRAGQSVQVTDNGEPLWILQPANGTDTDEAERRRAIDEILDEVLREKPSKISAAKLLEESRR